MVYLRRGSTRFWLTIPTREPGASVHLSTGVQDRKTAEAMEAMLKTLGARGQRRWGLLQPVIDGECTVARLYDHYVAGTLDTLAAEMADVDLAPHVHAWDDSLEDRYRGETPRKYRHHIQGLFSRCASGPNFERGIAYEQVMRSVVLAPGYIAKKLARVPGSKTNRRRHHEAWSACFAYLVDQGVIDDNPMRRVKKPTPDASRTPHIDHLRDVLRLVHAFPAGPHRAIAALREGGGLEMQAVLAMRGRDVADVEHRIVWAHGGKNVHRDRQAQIDAELWPIFDAYVRAGSFTPDALLFPVTADQHRAVHVEAVAAAREAGADIPDRYTPHAARHTYAIRKMRSGVEPTLTANNLGHADASMVIRLYGRYRPKITDIIRAGQAGAKEAK